MVTITHHVLGPYYSAVGVAYVVGSFFVKQVYLVATLEECLHLLLT